MVRHLMTGLFASLLLSVLAFGQAKSKSSAGKPKKKPAGKSRKLTPKEAKKAFLEKYDTNKDGKIDKKERLVARADYRKRRKSQRPTQRQRIMQQLLRRFDKNKDGKLDRKEQAEIRKAIAKQQQQMRKRFQSLLRRRKGGRGGSRGRSSGNANFRKLQQLRLRYLKELQKRQKQKQGRR